MAKAPKHSPVLEPVSDDQALVVRERFSGSRWARRRRKRRPEVISLNTSREIKWMIEVMADMEGRNLTEVIEDCVRERYERLGSKPSQDYRATRQAGGGKTAVYTKVPNKPATRKSNVKRPFNCGWLSTPNRRFNSLLIPSFSSAGNILSPRPA